MNLITSLLKKGGGELSTGLFVGLALKGSGGLLALVVSGSTDLSLLLESLDGVLVLPSDLVRQSAKASESTTRSESQHTESLRADRARNLVIRRRNSLEDLEVSQSGGTTRGLVGNHCADGSPENLGRSTEVEGTTGGVDVASLAQEVLVLDCEREAQISVLISCLYIIMLYVRLFLKWEPEMLMSSHRTTMTF